MKEVFLIKKVLPKNVFTKKKKSSHQNKKKRNYAKKNFMKVKI